MFNVGSFVTTIRHLSVVLTWKLSERQGRLCDVLSVVPSRVRVKYSTCYLYLSTYLSVLAVLEYLVYGNIKVLVLVLDQKYLVLSK